MSVEKLLAKDLLDEKTGFHYHYITQIRSVTKMHAHDFCEIFLVAQGSVIHRIAGREERLLEGTLMLVRPNDLHGYLPDGEGVCCIANLAFPVHWLQKALDYMDQNEANAYLTQKHPPQTLLTGERLKSAVQSFHQLREETVKTVIVQRLSDILFSKSGMDAQSAGQPLWLTQLAQTMQSPRHFTGGVEQMKRLCDKSPEHMYRMFKRFYHQTPSEYINTLKTAYAAHLLKHTDMTIIDIAMEAGFENLSYFYTCFKRQYETTPQKYRSDAHMAQSIPMGQ